MTGTRIFRIWCAMRHRCRNPNDYAYHRYGGRGIYVCKEWDQSFTAFFNDMGLPPSNQHSIDRIDNDGPYSPTNCRWATMREQSNNTESCRKISFNNKEKTITEWADFLGIERGTLASRIQRGWPIDRALTRKNVRGRTAKTITVDGKSLTVKEWSERLGVSPKVIHQRLHSGWPKDEAVTTPLLRVSPSRKNL